MITDEDRGDYRAVWWLGGDAFLQRASDSFPTFSMISSWNDTNELGSRHISGSSVAMGEGLIPLWRDLYNSELIMVTLRWGCIHVHLVKVRVRSSCFKTGSISPQRSVCLWTQQLNSEAGQNKWVKVAKKMWSRLRSNPGAVHFWLWKSVQEAIFYWSVVKIIWLSWQHFNAGIFPVQWKVCGSDVTVKTQNHHKAPRFLPVSTGQSLFTGPTCRPAKLHV